MDYVYFDHQGKGDAFVQALAARGYKNVPYSISSIQPIKSRNPRIIRRLPKPPAFALTDHDALGRIARLERLYQNGTRISIVYPHAARPNLYNDLYAGWPHTTAQLVVSEGHMEVLRRYGYSKPLHAVGWHLCPIREFQARPEVRRVLFAPIHPRCTRLDKNANNTVYNKLCALVERGEIDLTVRYIYSLQDSGIVPNDRLKDRIHYVVGGMRVDIDGMDNFDMIVAHQTYAWLAVARGIPTVMMGEDIPPHAVDRGNKDIFVRHWDLYKDLVMFPLDILHENDIMALMQRAARSDEEIREWKCRMIGGPFDADAFVRIVEGYL